MAGLSTETASGALQALGRELIQNLLVAVRSAQLYESSNATMRAAAERLARTVAELAQIAGVVRLEVSRDLVVVCDVRIRSELRHYSVQTNLLRFLRSIGVGGFEWNAEPDVERTVRFAQVIGRHSGGEGSQTELQERLRAAGLGEVEVLPPHEEVLEPLTEDPDARARAERTYRHSVAVTRDFMDGLRAGKRLLPYRVRRAVQSIVDQVLEDETLLIGLTNLRDYDEPTFSHSVNVCIFAVALGQRIGLSRLELYDLGMAALLHDIGKVDVPTDVLNKAGALSDEEWSQMQRHTVYGPWRIIENRTSELMPVREALAAFEHHLNVDLSGYPELRESRELSFYSRIIAICDSFDAGTTPRVYKTDPITPDEMLRILLKWQGVRYDPILLKAFIGLLGIYPAGCLCLLDTLEIGVVVACESDPQYLDRPRVRLLADADGNRLDGPTVSLLDRASDGGFQRTIIKVLDPERYGIDPAQTFV